MALPLAHQLGRARARSMLVATHPEDDLLGERDPDLLVVDERVVRLQRRDRRHPSLLVQRRLEHQPVPLANAPVPLRPELGPGPKQREVDVEQDSLQHAIEDRPNDQWQLRSAAGGGLRPPGGRARLFTVTSGAPSPLLQGSSRVRNPHSRIPHSAGKIGVPRFELGASPTRTERATRLRHTPSADTLAARGPNRCAGCASLVMLREMIVALERRAA